MPIKGYFKVMPCGAVDVKNLCLTCKKKDSCDYLKGKTRLDFGDYVEAHGHKLKLMDERESIQFQCKRCGACCKNNRIRLSPYDLLRIAGRLNITLSTVLDKYTNL